MDPDEDVFPIKNGDIPASHVSLPEGKSRQSAHHVFFNTRNEFVGFGVV